MTQAHLAWLKEFSVVMQRRYAYPPKHPSRVAAESTAFAAISRALDTYQDIAIGVTQRQLVINGAASDPKNPALGELAERLHRQGIGSITMRRGVTEAEFDALLDRVVSASPTTAEEDERPASQPGIHVAVDMLSYEGLTLSEDDDESGVADGSGERLWRELADLAISGWDGYDDAGSGGGGIAKPDDALATRPSGPVPVVTDVADGADPPLRPSIVMRRVAELPAALSAVNLAQMISARAAEPGYAAEVFKSLLKVGRHTRRRGRTGSGAVAARLRETLQRLEPGTLRSFLDAELDPERKQALLIQGVDALPVSAVIDWIEAAASNTDEGISQHLLRLLKKLSSNTHRRRDAGPDEGGESLREAARQLIEGWNFELKASEPHSALLERLAGYDAGAKSSDAGGSAGADRIVQTALETNVSGSDVIAAVNKLIDEKRLSLLFRFLDEVEGASMASPSITEHLLEPETVRRVLLTEPVERDGAQQLLSRSEAWQADAILDALSISESEATRRLILERLRELGESVRDQMIARMDGAPWYMQRNLLSLLAEMPEPPTELPLEQLAKHEEPMLRAEAMRVLARIPARRDAAVHDALHDGDSRVVRAAIDVALTGLPRRSAPRVLQILETSDRGSELRLRGIPLLAQVPIPTARDWLLGLVVRRRGAFMFRRWALTPKSPEMLAALRVLAQAWATDPAAAPALKLAARSDDRAIVDAAAARGAV